MGSVCFKLTIKRGRRQADSHVTSYPLSRDPLITVTWPTPSEPIVGYDSPLNLLIEQISSRGEFYKNIHEQTLRYFQTKHPKKNKAEKKLP